MAGAVSWGQVALERLRRGEAMAAAELKEDLRFMHYR